MANKRQTRDEVEGIFADLRVTTAKLAALQVGERIYATHRGYRYISTLAHRLKDRKFTQRRMFLTDAANCQIADGFVITRVQ